MPVSNYTKTHVFLQLPQLLRSDQGRSWTSGTLIIPLRDKMHFTTCRRPNSWPNTHSLSSFLEHRDSFPAGIRFWPP